MREAVTTDFLSLNAEQALQVAFQAAREKMSTFGVMHAVPPELPEVPAPASPIKILGTLNPYNGAWTYAQAAHLLRRTGFGLRHADVERMRTGSMSAAVSEVLNVPAMLPPPPVNAYNNPDFVDPAVPSGQPWVYAPYDANAEFYRIESWRQWWVGRMFEPSTHIQERMTLFWHHHFATQASAVPFGRLVYQHNQLLRQHSLGNFKVLTRAVTLDALMLIYLNGFLNTRDAPDENYARELQELFTIGKDNPDHYTEEDVTAAARILTGWRVNFSDYTTYHSPIDHDFGTKQFSAFYQNTQIQGSVFGADELDALLDMIFDRPEVAEYLCRKLYRWFVYYHIDEQIEQNIIQPLAQILRDSDYAIRPVLETLLRSDHFFAAAQTGCFVKTPLDVVAGVLRTFQVNLPSSTPWDGFVMRFYMSSFLSAMSMSPGDPPNVAGWQAFRQVPQYYRMWINGDTLRNRNIFTDVLAAGYLSTDNDTLKMDLIGFAQQFSNPGNPAALVEDSIRLLLPQPLSATKKFLLKSILLSGLPADSYWTAAWDAHLGNPGNAMLQEVVQTRLFGLYYYIMRLPEFQLG
jgi:uncharacterized protein (DUF1800 family)